MKETTHEHFWPGILPTNSSHHARARDAINYVHQSQSSGKVATKKSSRRVNRLEPIPVVDLFAGPGGLGEGFSALGTAESPTFQIKVSAEKDSAAHMTLKLRAYYRALLKTRDRSLIQLYYDYCHGKRKSPFDKGTETLEQEAEREALQLTLGESASNKQLDESLRQLKLRDRPWVLIGGPPCQAYSLVGRSRNRGKSDYIPEKDNRHFLYKEYLRIIQQYRPAVFVMENVKGLLSSKVGDQLIFHQMLRDLADPDTALGVKPTGSRASGYRIHSLSAGEYFESAKDLEAMDPSLFVVRAESFGVPQARHRVILLGVRADLGMPGRLRRTKPVSTLATIKRLPKLRSRLSRSKDDPVVWECVFRAHAAELAKAARGSGNRRLAVLLQRFKKARLRYLRDARELPIRNGKERPSIGKKLRRHFLDVQLQVWLNHEARGHMSADLRRYLYAAAFAKLTGKSPKGHDQFSLPGLAPSHKNWKSGKFADRFRVQVWNRPSTTVTSHISKDGHYYIHPDPMQCRSLTVREAARLQTFPDNYLFLGNRTQQYVQVGNAVPPFLAHQIARIVAGILSRK